VIKRGLYRGEIPRNNYCIGGQTPRENDEPEHEDGQEDDEGGNAHNQDSPTRKPLISLHHGLLYIGK
jgi:hypothetical protein